NAIKDPSLGARFKGSFRGAVGGLQEIAGGALQFAGSTGDGSAGVRLSEAGQERARKNAPYVAQATDIGDPGVGVADFVASTLGMLAPSVLESITAGIVGAGVGTVVGGPAGTVGGLAAGFAGKSVIKKSLLEAAKAQTKKTATKAQQKELADFASDKTGKDLLDAIRSQAGRQNAVGGAIVGTQVNNTTIGIGDVYSEGLEQGTEHRGIALGAGIAYGALETATEALLAGRVVSLLGNPKALTKARLGTRVGLTGLAGAGVEGATELGQESIVIGATGQFGDDGVGERLVNAFAAGAVGGGVLGGATGTLGLSRAGQQLKDGEPTDLVQNAQQFGGATVTEETTVQKPIVENIPTGVPKSSTVGVQTVPKTKGEVEVEQSATVGDTEFKTSAFPTQAQIDAAEEFADAEAAFNPLPNAPGVQPTPPPTQPPEQLTLPEQPVAYGAGVARPEASPDNVNNPIIQDLDNEINKKIRRNNARVDIHLARNN
ncbi:MAG: hypothetical protein K8953_09415, partial [Proteobacteria bacterium]|nr:hypothetical protein [Pseudomonadota bacterium]